MGTGSPSMYMRTPHQFNRPLNRRSNLKRIPVAEFARIPSPTLRNSGEFRYYDHRCILLEASPNAPVKPDLPYARMDAPHLPSTFHVLPRIRGSAKLGNLVNYGSLGNVAVCKCCRKQGRHEEYTRPTHHPNGSVWGHWPMLGRDVGR